MIFILTKSVQELESDCCAQQREQESVLAAICKSLKDEHQAELRKLQRQMTQVRENLRKQSSADKEMSFCTKVDMLWSVVPGQPEGGAAARAGNPASRERS